MTFDTNPPKKSSTAQKVIVTLVILFAALGLTATIAALSITIYLVVTG